MTYPLNAPWLLGLVLAVSLASTIELGRRTAALPLIHEDANRKHHLVAIRGGLFLLASLLLGFTKAPSNLVSVLGQTAVGHAVALIIADTGKDAEWLALGERGFVISSATELVSDCATSSAGSASIRQREV